MLKQSEDINTINCEEYFADENKQLLIGLVPYDTESWMQCDSWDMDTACQLIIFGRKLDIEFERKSIGDEIYPSPTQVRADEICRAYNHAIMLANSAINAGILKAHDSLPHWLQWASSKGYSVNHLLDDIKDPDGIVNHKLMEMRREIRTEMSNLKRAEIVDAEIVSSTINNQVINSNKKPLLQQLFQESEILRVIKELGLNPHELPKWSSGKKGIKSEVREKLISNKFTVTVFNKAWERLRADKRITE